MEEAITRILAEPARLSALHDLGLSDTDLPNLDRLARLAARLLQAPSALIALAEADRLRILGAHGPCELPAAAREAPLTTWLCPFVVASAAPLAISDTRAHPLGLQVAGLAEQGVIAFLGIPLCDSGATPLGALCVSDGAPRAWSDDDIAALSDLVPAVMAQLQIQQHTSARARAEAALYEGEVRFQVLAEHIDAVLWLMEARTEMIFYVSPAYRRIWGRNPADLYYNPSAFIQTIHPDDRAHAAAVFRNQLREACVNEYRVVRPDGRVVWISDASFPIRGPDGTITQVAGIATDVTDQRAIREALRESEGQYRLLFEHNPQPMFVYDLKSLRILAVNDAAIFHYGYTREECLAMQFLDLHLPEDQIFLMPHTTNMPGEFVHLRRTWRHIKKTGAIFEVELALHTIEFAGSPACLVMATDISDRRSLETQLAQAQKLDSLGRLAGGMAHDFNNTLTAIAGYANFVEESLLPGDPRREDVAQIVRAVRRANGLTRQLLVFARRQLIEPQTVLLNDLINDMSRLLRRLLGEQIALELKLDPAAGPVTIDPGQFEQVLMNMTLNAHDAMPGSGTLTVETWTLVYDDRGPPPAPDLRPGRYTVIAVSDTGSGIPADLLPHIFEPFVTTKEPGKGTGLGLAVCHGIITQAGGHIWVASVAGRGTTFTIALPEERSRPQAQAEPPAEVDSGGAETILLAEDDLLVRTMVAQALRSRGYTVIEADDGARALALARERLGRIDLVLSDIGLPHISGLQLARDLRKLSPTLPVLLISGYTEDDAAQRELHAAGIAFLPKPFAPAMLMQQVRAVLDHS
jgi:two-component system cell cycle sensor histidine kinase/response regulator CckA